MIGRVECYAAAAYTMSKRDSVRKSSKAVTTGLTGSPCVTPANTLAMSTSASSAVISMPRAVKDRVASPVPAPTSGAVETGRPA